MSATEEKKSVTGLDQAENRKDAEYNLLEGLLKAAEYKTSDENIVEVDLKRNGVYLFTVHLHPISDKDAKFARKKATKMVTNPAGAKYPKIEGEFDAAVFNSWLIYLATTEEDQENIWGNSHIKTKYGLANNIDSLDILLTIGEKSKLAETVMEISDMSDEEDAEETMDEVEFAKN
jgi:hypothetical protein